MFRSACFAAALLVAAPAFAQVEPAGEPDATDGEALDQAPPLDEPPPTGSGLDLSGSLTALSDYRFRGVSRSDEDPAVQARLTLSHDSGLYAGVTATTLKGLDSFRLRDPGFRDLGDVEVDLYAGYGAQLGGGFSLDAGLLYYLFAGGDGATDYVEPYASLSYLIGPVDITAGAKYAPSQDAIGDEDMLYLFGQVDASIPFSRWRFSALLGHQDWGRFGDYWTWSLGTEYRLPLGRGTDVAIGLRYVDTDLPSISGQDATAVLTVGLNF
jgi:uncharacterized protein (TIGR02001 family)